MDILDNINQVTQCTRSVYVYWISQKFLMLRFRNLLLPNNIAKHIYSHYSNILSIRICGHLAWFNYMKYLISSVIILAIIALPYNQNTNEILNEYPGITFHFVLKFCVHAMLPHQFNKYLNIKLEPFPEKITYIKSNIVKDQYVAGLGVCCSYKQFDIQQNEYGQLKHMLWYQNLNILDTIC